MFVCYEVLNVEKIKKSGEEGQLMKKT